MQHERIQDRARGRWKSILPALGVSAQHLSGRHGACPLCGGKDRFRFDDKAGSGSWICSHCGAGNGVDLVMKINGIKFIDAKLRIEDIIGTSPVEIPKAAKDDRYEATKDQLAALWGRAQPLDGSDIASRFLRNRAINLSSCPPSLRWLPDLPYRDDGGTQSLHPAMLAKFAAPDDKSATLHRTYLCEPGKKAEVPSPRKLMPGKHSAGSAVRLAAPAETMGIAEGIETAIAASILHEVPVWSALTAGNLIKWKPPSVAKYILVFGDSDKSFAGQSAAYSLAYRLKTEGFDVEVRVPDELGTDWNDVLEAHVHGDK